MPWGTREQTAEHYGCSLSAIDRARKAGKLKSSKELGRVKVELIPPEEFYGRRIETPVELVTPQKRKQKLDISLEGYDRRYLKGVSGLSKFMTRWRYCDGVVYRIKNPGGKVSWGIEFRDENGKRKQQIVRGAQSRKDAEDVLDYTARNIFKRKFGIAEPETKSITFQRFSVMYLEDYSKTTNKSWETVEHRLKSLVNFFFDMELREITPTLIKRYRSSRLKNQISKSTVNREVALLKHMFNVAIDENYLELNPTKKIMMYSEADTIRDRVLSREEEPRLFAELPDRLKPFFYVACHTGMRRSEIFKLEWRNVVLKGCRDSYIKVERTKSRKARTIPVNSQLYEILIQLKNRQGAAKYVFPFKSVRTAFENACKRAGITDFTFHDLRRTFGTRLLKKGVDIVTISKLYGHSSVLVTQRYLHPEDTLSRHAVEKLVEEPNMLEICELKGETDQSETQLIN